MSGFVILLLILSAFTHAGWNLLGKRQGGSPAFLLVAHTLGTLCLLPVLALVGVPGWPLPFRVWLLCALTGLCQAIYYAGLALAYRSGDLSLAYPLARSLPVVFVALGARALGQGEPVTSLALAGMALIVVGGLLLPLDRLGELRPARYIQGATAFALLAALGTTGYSLIDDAALRALRPAGALATPLGTTLLYAFWEGISAALWLLPMVLLSKSGHAELRRTLAGGLGRAALTGVGIYLAYSIVLVAMTYAANVSYVVAFRQLSIPLGALAGMALLHESRPVPRLVGMGVMVAGLVLTGIG